MQRLGEYRDKKPAEAVRFLVDEGFIEVDERAVEILAANSYDLEFLFRNHPNVLITEQAVIQAAADEKALCILLEKRIEDIPISTKVILAVAGALNPVANLQRVLEHFGWRILITEDVLTAAARNFAALQLLLEAPGPNVPVPASEKVVVHATYRDLSALVWLFQGQRLEVPLTERVLVAAAATSLSGLKWLLRELPTDIDLNHI